jgi:hypothetical protein
VENQTHPHGVWHCKEYEPRSLVLENVTGTSCIFTRLRKGHMGLHKQRYFKEDHKHLHEEVGEEHHCGGHRLRLVSHAWRVGAGPVRGASPQGDRHGQDNWGVVDVH